MDRLTQERIAQNNSRFRDANEHIRRAAEEYRVGIAVPFICECPDPTCMEVVRLELADYRDVRTNPRAFLKAVSHGPGPGPAARILAEHDGHMVVEKTGYAGEVAEQLARGVDRDTAERDS